MGNITIAIANIFCWTVGSILVGWGSNWKVGLGVALVAYFVRNDP